MSNWLHSLFIPFSVHFPNQLDKVMRTKQQTVENEKVHVSFCTRRLDCFCVLCLFRISLDWSKASFLLRRDMKAKNVQMLTLFLSLSLSPTKKYLVIIIVLQCTVIINRLSSSTFRLSIRMTFLSSYPLDSQAFSASLKHNNFVESEMKQKV